MHTFVASSSGATARGGNEVFDGGALVADAADDLGGGRGSSASSSRPPQFAEEADASIACYLENGTLCLYID